MHTCYHKEVEIKPYTTVLVAVTVTKMEMSEEMLCPVVFHTKLIESVLGPIAQEVIVFTDKIMSIFKTAAYMDLRYYEKLKTFSICITFSSNDVLLNTLPLFSWVLQQFYCLYVSVYRITIWLYTAEASKLYLESE